MSRWHREAPLTLFKKRLTPGCEECSVSLKDLPQFSSQGHAPVGVALSHRLSGNCRSLPISAQGRALLILSLCSRVLLRMGRHSDWHHSLTSPLWPSLCPPFPFIGVAPREPLIQPVPSTSLSASQEPNLQGTGVRGKVVSLSITESGGPYKWKWPKRTESQRKRQQPWETWPDSLMNTREMPPTMRVSINK